MATLFKRAGVVILILAVCTAIYFIFIQPGISNGDEEVRSKISFNSCDDLPSSFSSYEEAADLILNADYPYSDEVNTSRSSWIRSAWFLTCDGHTGFFCYTTDKKTYIHQDVPRSIWNEFKEAESFGRYYNNNIKGRYRLKIN